jgi:hypothetical protein
LSWLRNPLKSVEEVLSSVDYVAQQFINGGHDHLLEVAGGEALGIEYVGETKHYCLTY